MNLVQHVSSVQDAIYSFSVLQQISSKRIKLTQNCPKNHQKDKNHLNIRSTPGRKGIVFRKRLKAIGGITLNSFDRNNYSAEIISEVCAHLASAKHF